MQGNTEGNMDTILTIAIAGTAFVLGALIVWIWCGRILAKIQAKIPPLETEIFSLRPLKDQLDATRLAAGEAEKSLASATTRVENLAVIEAELVSARQQVNSLTANAASLAAKYEAATQSHKEQIEQLTSLRQGVQDQFKLLASEALTINNENFSKRAEEVFRHQKEVTTKDISDLVKPLGETLKAYDEALKEIEKARIAGFTTINDTLQSVSAQHTEVKTVTANLVNALRASPKTRGRWGEETLRRVVELSGLVEHCDFETEKHFKGEDESLRPDMVITVSGGRSIVVDAKAPVSAYIDAISATGEDDKEAQLKKHSIQLRERLRNLSSKSYWEHFAGSVDCVVMFVPGDNFVSAAFERDPDLFEDGIKARVLICTPTTFIALTKAISYGWRQEKFKQSAIEVGQLGKELYARLRNFGDHVSDLGKHLSNSTKKYNLLVGSLESSVMPQARRFNELGVEGTAEPLPQLSEVDTVVKFPQGGRDLLISEVKKGE
jgi:DNA recombination protein RmuC